MSQESLHEYLECNNDGHNSITCKWGQEEGSFKLFGVMINPHENNVRKISSMGNLELSSDSNSIEQRANNAEVGAGYISDGRVPSNVASTSLLRKKAQPWTDNEHNHFLLGLEKLGKGNWKEIAKEFVPTRTSTQVASHAQKYFLRKLAISKHKKRRMSVFDKSLTEADTTTPTTRVANLSLPHRVQGLPNPHLVGITRNEQSCQTSMNAYATMMNAMRLPYVYVPNTHGNYMAWAQAPSQIIGVQPHQNHQDQVTPPVEIDFLSNGSFGS